jgi:hypothetical protein
VGIRVARRGGPVPPYWSPSPNATEHLWTTERQSGEHRKGEYTALGEGCMRTLPDSIMVSTGAIECYAASLLDAPEESNNDLRKQQ